MNTEQILEEINKVRPELEEIAHIQYFEAYLNHKKIIIEISDYGEEEDEYLRYGIIVHQEGNKRIITGNGGKTLNEALKSVHWNELDK